ncbi:MAG: MlaD family protein, partial [Halomonas sp.]|nr:MlaD family protein [Halomonas sp.]MDX5503550.1 MlaD family protein [Halomonas sp.]
MKRSKTMELGVGLFMLAGILGLLFLGLRVSGLTFSVPSDTFRLEANFANIGSLKPRARVTMSGVTVGRVTAIELDREWYDARVILELDAELEGQLSR